MSSLSTGFGWPRRIPSETRVSIDEVPLRIQYHFNEGQPAGLEREPIPDEVEVVTAITQHGDYVTRLLSDKQLAEISDVILKNLKAEELAP